MRPLNLYIERVTSKARYTLPVSTGRVRHFGHVRSQAVSTAREHGPRTRVVCTKLKLHNSDEGGIERLQ